MTSGLTTLIILIATVLPIVQIAVTKRTWVEMSGAIAAGRGAIWNSFILGALSATTLLVLGSLIGIFMNGTQNRSRTKANLQRFDALLWLPFLVPGVLVGILLIFVFNRDWSVGFYRSVGIIVLALCIRYAGVGWRMIRHAFASVDPELTEAAAIDGANRWQLFRYVRWFQMREQLAVVWYLVYLLCLWDAETLVLIIPPGRETLALRIFNLLHYGHNPQVNALCLTLLGLAILPLVLWKGFGLIGQFYRSSSAGAGIRWVSIALAALCLSGCSRHSATAGAALSSKLFARAETIGSRGVGVGQLNKPRSVAIDKEDNLYVVDMTGRVQKFSQTGAFLLSWQMPQTDLGRPKGMCRDLDGNIVVVEPHYQRINHFTPSGKLVSQWGQRGTNAGLFSMPRAAGIDSHDEVFVSEYGLVERVQKFSLSPTVKFLSSFGEPGNGPGQLNRPEGLCVDSKDRVYIADSCNHRIQIFSSDGKFIRTYGKPGSGLGELSYPYDICVDTNGRQYVCEFGNSRIQVFDAEDRPIEIIGSAGAEPGKFANPWGVALDSQGNLYVADSQNHRVEKLVARK